MKQVEVFSTGACPYCVQAKRLLDKKGVAYEEVRVDMEPDRKQEMLDRSGGRRTVPQIFIGGEAIGGFQELHALENSGELDKLLS